MSDNSSEDNYQDEEGLSPMMEVVYPVDEETEVPQTQGQLFKTVLAEGIGSKPPKGAKVTVHYVGTLVSDGSKFGSSRDYNEYFDFTIGQGQVIKGWDVGVATMRKGEKCNLRCLPEYAYGASGSPPKIPPNSTLNFEVELFDWSKMEDISAHKDKTLMKSVITEGKDWETPDYETEVKGQISVLSSDEDDATVVTAAKPFAVVIGDCDLPAGIEDAIKTMKKSESAKVMIKKIAGAHPDFPTLAAGQPAVFQVDIEDFTKVKTWEVTGVAKVEEAKKRKEAGNAFFIKKDFAKAIAKYNRGLEFIDVGLDQIDDEEAKTTGQALKISMWSNRAQCHLSLGQMADCITYCDKVLREEPNNAKALFRRGKAKGASEDWDGGIKDLKQLMAADPANGDAARELAAIQEVVRRHNAAQKARYGNMFAKMSAMEEKEKAQ